MERPPINKLRMLTTNSDHNLAAVFDYVEYLEKQLRGRHHEVAAYRAALEGGHHRLSTSAPPTGRTITDATPI